MSVSATREDEFKNHSVSLELAQYYQTKQHSLAQKIN